MKAILFVLLLCANLAFAALPAPGEPGAINDPRYCGEPKRDPVTNRIERDHEELQRFMDVFPCPGTLDPKYGACQDWAIDHTIPLVDGGCDIAINMTWLPFNLKSCAGACKDRWERKYHAFPRQKIDIRALIKKGQSKKPRKAKADRK